jgi:hypothetical protein
MIALSVSPTEDMAQQGMGPEHLNDALGEISRQLLALGARLMYGGDLRAGGITRMLFELAARYFPPSARDEGHTPAIVDVIPYPWHAELSFDDLTAWEVEFATVGELRFMNRAGNGTWILPGRPDNLVQLPRDEWVAALTAMRNYVTHNSVARIVIGGKTMGYFGRMPGISEEAFVSIAAGQPLFAVGGFGGAAEPIARSIAAHENVRFPGMNSAFPVLTPNGLEERELQRLSQSPHIDEVAILITRGLNRLFAH